MSVTPTTVDIVVADMGAALAFYRTLGLAAPMEEADQPQVNIYTPGGATIGLLTEALMRHADPGWVTPVGQRVTFACRCESPDELDATYTRVTGAAVGHALGAALRLPARPGRQPRRSLRRDRGGRRGAALTGHAARRPSRGGIATAR